MRKELEKLKIKVEEKIGRLEDKEDLTDHDDELMEACQGLIEAIETMEDALGD